MQRTVLALAVVALSVAYPLVSAYHVDPKTAAQSGWALGDEQHGVSQLVTCNFDSVVYCGGEKGTLYLLGYAKGTADLTVQRGEPRRD
jgi:hypothetical protein